MNIPGACGQPGAWSDVGTPLLSGAGGGNGGGRAVGPIEDSPTYTGKAGTANSGGGGSGALQTGSNQNGGAGGSGFCVVWEMT